MANGDLSSTPESTSGEEIDGTPSRNNSSDSFVYGTRAAIIMTAVAMSMCAASLSLPLYEMTYSNEVVLAEGTWVFHEEYVFHLDYMTVSDRGYYSYDATESIDGLTYNLTLMIAIWLAMGTFYIASCVLGSRALVRGFLLQACSILPVVYFAAAIPHAIGGMGIPSLRFTPDDFFGSVSSYPYDGSDRTWGPESGWLLLLLACIIQVVVITRRNAPMVAEILSRMKAARLEESDSQ